MANLVKVAPDTFTQPSIILPKILQNHITIVINRHTEKTGHTKFTVLGLDRKRKKHQKTWQVIKCKECNKSIT